MDKAEKASCSMIRCVLGRVRTHATLAASDYKPETLLLDHAWKMRLRPLCWTATVGRGGWLGGRGGCLKVNFSFSVFIFPTPRVNKVVPLRPTKFYTTFTHHASAALNLKANAKAVCLLVHPRFRSPNIQFLSPNTRSVCGGGGWIFAIRPNPWF